MGIDIERTKTLVEQYNTLMTEAKAKEREANDILLQLTPGSVYPKKSTTPVPTTTSTQARYVDPSVPEGPMKAARVKGENG